MFIHVTTLQGFHYTSGALGLSKEGIGYIPYVYIPMLVPNHDCT